MTTIPADPPRVEELTAPDELFISDAGRPQDAIAWNQKPTNPQCKATRYIRASPELVALIEAANAYVAATDAFFAKPNGKRTKEGPALQDAKSALLSAACCLKGAAE